MRSFDWERAAFFALRSNRAGDGTTGLEGGVPSQAPKGVPSRQSCMRSGVSCTCPPTKTARLVTGQHISDRVRAESHESVWSGIAYHMTALGSAVQVMDALSVLLGDARRRFGAHCWPDTQSKPAQRPDWRGASPEAAHSWLMYKKVSRPMA